MPEWVNEIRNFLEMQVDMRRMMLERARRVDADPYYCMEDFILRNGRPFMPRKFPSHLQKGEMKQCFRNATVLSRERPELAYVEGYACGVIPVMHAWCVDRLGNVYDPTWLEGTAYYGVVFSGSYVCTANIRRERYGVIDFWEGGWPLLTGEDSLDEALLTDWVEEELDVLQWKSVI